MFEIEQLSEQQLIVRHYFCTDHEGDRPLNFELKIESFKTS